MEAGRNSVSESFSVCSLFLGRTKSRQNERPRSKFGFGKIDLERKLKHDRDHDDPGTKTENKCASVMQMLIKTSSHKSFVIVFLLCRRLILSQV